MSGRHGPRWIPGGERVRQQHHEAVKAAKAADDAAAARRQETMRELDEAIDAAVQAQIPYRELAELTGQGKSVLHARFPRRAAP